MPKLKRKSVSQRNVAMRSLMRSRRSAGDEGTDCSVPDEGRDGSTDLLWSVPDTAASAVRPSGLGSVKQTEVQACLFKPSGSSVQALKNRWRSSLPLKPSGSSVRADLLNDLLVELADEALVELPNVLPSRLPAENLVNDTTEPENEKTCVSGEVDNDSCFIPQLVSSEVNQVCTQLAEDCFYTATPIIVESSKMSYISIVYGSFCQGDSRFSVYSRGSQCTINSLCALIYARYSNITARETLDEVLNVGDQLYQIVLHNLKNSGKFKHRLLCLDEIPDQVNVLSRNVFVQKSNVVSGVAVELPVNSALPSLHQSLHTAFLNVQHILVMIGAICSAVFVKDDMFWLFDSHSHGKHGLSSPDGKSVLMSFASLDDLVIFLYAMYESMNIDLSCQFEILPLQFTVSCVESSLFFIANPEDEVKDKEVQTTERKTKADSKKVSEDILKNNPLEVANCPTLPYASKNIAYGTFHQEHEQLNSYFEDQHNKALKKGIGKNNIKINQDICTKYLDNCKEQISLKTNKRRVYMRKLMQAKRAKETADERNARQYVEKQQKEIARSDPLKRDLERQKEKQQKEIARSDPLKRDLERQNEKQQKEIARSDPQKRDLERQKEKQQKEKARSDPQKRDLERQKEKQQKEKARSDPQKRDLERQNEKQQKEIARSDPQKRDLERQKEKQQREIARSDPQNVT